MHTIGRLPKGARSGAGPFGCNFPFPLGWFPFSFTPCPVPARGFSWIDLLKKPTTLATCVPLKFHYFPLGPPVFATYECPHDAPPRDRALPRLISSMSFPPKVVISQIKEATSSVYKGSPSNNRLRKALHLRPSTRPLPCFEDSTSSPAGATRRRRSSLRTPSGALCKRQTRTSVPILLAFPLTSPVPGP